MYKIGVIGDRNSVLGFKAVGLDVFPCQDREEAKGLLHRIAKEEYAIIYITEKLCKDMVEDIARYKDDRIPAIIPIPGIGGSYGIGMANLKKSVERAVGADILFGNE
jgi:V/A-type H+-transporting ATPase subunit F